MTLTWKPPKNDGGSPVTHYIVEQLWWDSSGKQKESWRQCNRRDIDTTTFKVEDLHEGAEYEFRVKAVNEAGASRPSSTAGPIIVKDQTSVLNTPRFIHCVARLDLKCYYCYYCKLILVN